MKHSIFLKFTAIVLCAASLLTLGGCAFGLYCMVELDLYDRTVDEFIEESYRSDSQYYAQTLAHRYAGRELGGLPKDFLENEYPGWYGRQFAEGSFGYAIYGPDGTVLEVENEAVRDHPHTLYSFPVEGNYMHLVSSEPIVEEQAPSPYEGLGEGEYGIIDRVGEGTVPVYFIRASHDGGSEGIGSATPLGFLMRMEDGSIQFSPNGSIGLQFVGDAEITHITFMDMDEHILYEVADEHPVAIITAELEGGHTIHLLKENEKPVTSQKETSVYRAIFYGPDSDEPIEILGSSQPIGTASLDENGVLDFQLFVESTVLKNAPAISSMVLLGQDGTVLFGIAMPQISVTGAPVATAEGLSFTSDPNALALAMPKDADTAAEEDNTAAMAEETVPATVPETTAVPETTPETGPVTINGKALEEYDVATFIYRDNETGERMEAKVVYLAMPEYTVNIFFRQDLDRNAHYYGLMRLLKQFSGLLLPGLLVSLALIAITAVYLCTAAGHRAKTSEIQAGGLNRLPLDLYLLLAGSMIVGFAALAMVTCTDLLPRNAQVSLVLIPLFAYAACLVFVGFCFALVAQCKTPGGYWWRNSLCARLLTGGVGSLKKGTHWTIRRFFPWLWTVFVKLWDLCLFTLEGCWKLIRFLWNRTAVITKLFFRWVFRLLRRGMDMLPLIWQWLLGGLVLMFFGLLVWANRNDGWGMVWLLVGLGLILYISNCFGLLYEGAIRMNKGNLETKIDDKKLMGCFRNFAMDLNNLADVVVASAQKQLRSERMKTELITNVSHDIKTPLTSIINYVDLLQKPHTEEEGAQYLEVLDRQSQRLKKLIDDLMDMSKANTGNMHVELTRLDAVESVNQALGEFSDKLERAELTPLFRHNADEAFIMADGKLVWRVLSNLLNNAVKYAMPGTRLYVDLMKLDGRVVLSLKNISRDELNVDAEELMERFVRGDDSRNTEGSGLGLNIAKSLMELQKGHLQLLVDGDLFKVTLVFPSDE